MFRIESYVTPILLSYVDKYVKDFNPADAQVSLWGGGVALHNLVIKTDVLQQEVSLPFTLVSGRIHELLIQVPWTKIMSEPIVVTIDIIECILSLRPPPSEETQASEAVPSASRRQRVETPPGYMQALVRRIVSNISIQVHHLILKYVQDDAVMSLNIKHLCVQSAGTNWQPTFADIDQNNPEIRRLVNIDDLTLCLDRSDADGKIRFYQEPLLYRCRMEFRVLMKLESANSRRARSISCEIFSEKIAFSMSSEQLVLFLRLIKEHTQKNSSTPTTNKVVLQTGQHQISHTIDSAIPKSEEQESVSSSEAPELVRNESWADWAWSWMPSWSESTPERAGAYTASLKEPPVAQPTPVDFAIYLSEISFAFTIMEMEGSSRKRSRNLIELSFVQNVLKGAVNWPTLIKVRLGIRTIYLKTTGACSCGHLNYYALHNEPMYYLSNAVLPGAWEYPKDGSSGNHHVVDEPAPLDTSVSKTSLREKTRINLVRTKLDNISTTTEGEKAPKGKDESIDKNKNVNDEKEDSENIQAKVDNVIQSAEKENSEAEEALGKVQKSLLDFDVTNIDFVDLFPKEPAPENPDPSEQFWRKMAPVISISFVHERSPKDIGTSPYENIPQNFEYSDWQEECNLFITVQPLDMEIDMGLIHRLEVIKDMFTGVFVEAPLPPGRKLTVEECDALTNNLPQRKISVEVHGFGLSVHPVDHSLNTRAVRPPVLLDIDLPKTNLIIVMPLYPLRVCSAAAQLPKEETAIWRGARLHLTGAISNAQILLASGKEQKRKPCGRFDVRFVVHSLMCRPYFESRNTVNLSYVVKLREINFSGSAPRLLAVLQILLSYVNRKYAAGLRYSTLPKDALVDEGLVALDITAEDCNIRGFFTSNVTTQLIILQSIRATLCQNEPGRKPKQAWLLAGPDAITSTPLLRFGVQICDTPGPAFVDYLAYFTEQMAIVIDPMFIEWLSYRPFSRLVDLCDDSKKSLQSLRRRASPVPKPPVSPLLPPLTEQVHVRRSSQESSSGPSEKKEKKEPPPQPQPPQAWWEGETLLKIHQRLKHILIAFDMGLILIYLTTKTASAVDCASVSLAMENHAVQNENVMIFSAGRWSLTTSLTTTHLWHFIEKDGPTYKTGKPKVEDNLNSFPWKMIIADVSCYSISPPPELILERLDKPSSLKSQLKYTRVLQPRYILEHVTTSLTLSVVTKSLQHKIVVKKAEMKTTQKPTLSKRDAKLKYFQSGHDFVPTSLKDFLRGPMRHKRDTATQSGSPTPLHGDTETINAPVHVTAEGPLVSLGFQLHADTPPVKIRIEHDQVPLVAATVHCLKHLALLLKTRVMYIARPRRTSGVSRTSVSLYSIPKEKSVTQVQELEEELAEESVSEEEELTTIFDRRANEDSAGKLKTFILLQWVINRVTLIVSTEEMKIAFNIDDVITTIDLQHTYNQLKVKIASAVVKHFVRKNNDQWEPGELGGKVLEAREPADAMEDEYFLCVTITQAQICNLPPSWKVELHPKLLEQKCENDTMWEIYAVLAPLDLVIHPSMINNFVLFANTFAPPYFCDLSGAEEKKKIFDLPFVYLNMGALRLILSCTLNNPSTDNTLVLTVGKISINPHPDNPICRRPVLHADANWQSMSGSLDGRQYELSLTEIQIQSTKFSDIICEEEAKSASSLVPGGENPAKKWSEPLFTPELTTILHPMDINLLLAPPLHLNNVLACGSALELNLISDCAIELSVNQLHLVHQLVSNVQQSLLTTVRDNDSCLEFECPYAVILNPISLMSERTFHFSHTKPTHARDTEVFTATIDSGVETASRSTGRYERQSSDISIVDSLNASDFKEMCITMGVIELSLYVEKDNSRKVEELSVEKPKPPGESSETAAKLRKVQPVTAFKSMMNISAYKNISATDLVRNRENNVPLMHMALYQPNLYYWKRRYQSDLQISLFNMWMGHGIGRIQGHWCVPLITTTRGELDPITEIPPALITLKYYSGNTAGSALKIANPTHGTLNVDVDRPFKIDLSTKSLMRLLKIAILVNSRLEPKVSNKSTPAPDPALYRLKHALTNYNIEEVKICTTQIGVAVQDIMAGWDSANIGIKLSTRPEKIDLRGLIQAFVITNTMKTEDYIPIMQPLHLGCKMAATWDAWRRIEGPLLAKKPSLHFNLDLTNLTVDVTPETPALVEKILNTLEEVQKTWKARPLPVSIENKPKVLEKDTVSTQVVFDNEEDGRERLFYTYFPEKDLEEEHYYKDDLRSGAFKILYGGHIPLPYQVTLLKDIVSWSYPHPRAITRLLAYPMLNKEEELKCVLEFYNRILLQWEPYAYVKLPFQEEREFDLDRQTQEMVFASTWRFRVVAKGEDIPPFVFDMKKFEHTLDPGEEVMLINAGSSDEDYAERILGILQVDSYFAPRQTPRFKIDLRLGSFEISVHNISAALSTQAPVLEGYNVMSPHRVMSFIGHDTIITGQFGSSTGKIFLLRSKLSTNLIDCSTGTMGLLTRSITLQTGISIPNNLTDLAKIRFCASDIQVDMNITRLRTLQSLVDDWSRALSMKPPLPEKVSTEVRRESAEKMAVMLEGRVALWIINSCSAALRLGQIDTDEVLPIEPGARLAYRWHSPTAPRRLRFAFADPSTNWHWSNDIPFTEGSYRVRLEDLEGTAVTSQMNAEILYVLVKRTGAHLKMRLSGRLMMANMLRLGLYYKVRARRLEQNTWQTIASNTLLPEHIGRSVICPTSSDIVLKIRFEKQNTGWSGDIPLKECPKENVPWLVKVPSEGQFSYISVWCRVVSARSDGRIFASIWPLYFVVSHLSLDIDVLVVSDMGTLVRQEDGTFEDLSPPPLIQSVEGRGATTHLLCPGTTSARHTLSFQYRNIECPVTREAVPLHYGVTDTSVFEKQPPINDIYEVFDEIVAWLNRSGRGADTKWPYSIVASHWQGQWKPAMLQPKSDVSVRYQAVNAGGGCSLQLQLCPVLLLCNASTTTLTIRAHDAAPLCKLETGAAIALPSVVLHKPFFLSIDINRETYVSKQLRIGSEDPGRYGSPPEGVVTLDHPVTFTINCIQKLAIFTLHYEIKEEVNVMGLTSSYVFVNELNCDVLNCFLGVKLEDITSHLAYVSPKLIQPSSTWRSPNLVSCLAMPSHEDKMKLTHMDYKSVPAKTKFGVSSIPIVQFSLTGRCFGDLSELRLYLCLSIVDSGKPVPVPLGQPPERRSTSMRDARGREVAVVVTQHKHEGRWVIALHTDPCPQFVINNLTSSRIVVAAPVFSGDLPVNSADFEIKEEFPNSLWRCEIDIGDSTPYSRPDYVMQTATTYSQPRLTYLTFTSNYENHADWWQYFCTPVAVTEGEQLVRLRFGHVIKMRVRSYPHSTLIELRDINHNDLSAKDIRSRLQDSRHDTQEHVQHKQFEPLRIDDKFNFVTVKRHGETFEATMENVRSRLNNIKTNLVASKQENLKSINTESSAKLVKRKKSAPNLSSTAKTEIKDVESAFPFSLSRSIIDVLSKSKADSDTELSVTASTKSKVHELNAKKADTSLAPEKTERTETATTSKPVVREAMLAEPQNQTDKDLFVLATPETLDEDIRSTESASEISCTPDYCDENHYDWKNKFQLDRERVRIAVAGVVVSLAADDAATPLLAVHIDHSALNVTATNEKMKVTVAVANVQVDNLQYESGQFDFAVIATTCPEGIGEGDWPCVWAMFSEEELFDPRAVEAKLMLKTTNETWTVLDNTYSELTEVEFRAGPLALYIEDSYVKALAKIIQQISKPQDHDEDLSLNEARTLRSPLRLSLLNIHPVDLTLTLHTAVRMYIALDQSPLRLSSFKLHNMFISTECLVHALTVHYLSAALLGAGWVVGGLELLGAPGALAARVGGARGGVRGVAQAAAAALLRSLSAWAGSLARNLDLLAGDEEHAQRAAAARRRPPDSFVQGVLAGLTNFAINILGAVGGLAHHPLVGVAVGESGSSTMALRRTFLGALTKPLSATADLVAYAGNGLLKQTGWDPVPQPRPIAPLSSTVLSGWQRDCVRWSFRMADLRVVAGYEVLLNDSPVQLLLTKKYFVTLAPCTDTVTKTIHFKDCVMGPYEGGIIEIQIVHNQPSIIERESSKEDEDVHVSAEAMARVARYTGAEGGNVETLGGGVGSAIGVGLYGFSSSVARTLLINPPTGTSLALHAVLTALIHANTNTHFSLI